MLYRIWRWSAWTVLFAMIPFIAATVSLPLLTSSNEPYLVRMTGSGQLLLTSVALLGGGLRELSGMESEFRKVFRDSIMSISILFALLVAVFYGTLVGRMSSGLMPVDLRQYVAMSSVVVFVISLFLAGTAVVTSSPRGSSSR